jgi:hypothetical protein
MGKKEDTDQRVPTDLWDALAWCSSCAECAAIAAMEMLVPCAVFGQARDGTSRGRQELLMHSEVCDALHARNIEA